MNIEELKQKLEESRKRSVEYRGATLQLRIPNNREVTRALRPFINAPEGDDSGERALVAAAITGWQDVRVAHLLKGGTLDDIPYSLEAAKIWLEEDRALWQLISGMIFASLTEREDSEKNSVTASPSSEGKQPSSSG